MCNARYSLYLTVVLVGMIVGLKAFQGTNDLKEQIAPVAPSSVSSIDRVDNGGGCPCNEKLSCDRSADLSALIKIELVKKEKNFLKFIDSDIRPKIDMCKSSFMKGVIGMFAPVINSVSDLDVSSDEIEYMERFFEGSNSARKKQIIEDLFKKKVDDLADQISRFCSELRQRPDGGIPYPFLKNKLHVYNCKQFGLPETTSLADLVAKSKTVSDDCYFETATFDLLVFFLYHKEKSLAGFVDKTAARSAA